MKKKTPIEGCLIVARLIVQAENELAKAAREIVSGEYEYPDADEDVDCKEVWNDIRRLRGHLGEVMVQMATEEAIAIQFQ